MARQFVSEQIEAHIKHCWRCWVTINLDLPRRKYLCNVILSIFKHGGIEL